MHVEIEVGILEIYAFHVNLLDGLVGSFQSHTQCFQTLTQHSLCIVGQVLILVAYELQFHLVPCNPVSVGILVDIESKAQLAASLGLVETNHIDVGNTIGSLNGHLLLTKAQCDTTDFYVGLSLTGGQCSSFQYVVALR